MRCPLDRDVTQRTIKSLQTEHGKIKDVCGETPYAGGRLDDREFTWGADGFPNSRELPSQQAAEDRVNVHAGVIVGEACGFGAAVVAVAWIVEARLHVLREGQRTVRGDAAESSRARGVSLRMYPGSRIGALRIPGEHLDYVVVQAIVELTLKGPGELRIFDLARTEQKDVRVNFGVLGLEANLNLDAFGGRSSGEIEKWVFVTREFVKNLRSEFFHIGFGHKLGQTGCVCAGRSPHFGKHFCEHVEGALVVQNEIYALDAGGGS